MTGKPVATFLVRLTLRDADDVEGEPTHPPTLERITETVERAMAESFPELDANATAERVDV